MALNVKRMREKADALGNSGDFLKFDEGETLLYIHPCLPQADQHESTDGINFLEFGVHYKVGPEGKMVISLDPESNPILDHPAIQSILKKRKIKLTGQCPVKEALEGDELTSDEQERSKLKSSYLWGCTPVAYRRGKSMEFQALPFKPTILQCGKQITEGILDVICEEGDITDPDKAVLVRVIRSGKGMDTEYKVKPDNETSKKPKQLAKDQKAALKKAMTPGGDCDLFRVLGQMIKSPAQVQAIIDGIELDGSETVTTDDDDDSDEGVAVSEVEESDEGEAVAATAEGEAEQDSSEESSEEEESKEEEPPPKPAKAKPKADKEKPTKPAAKPKEKPAADEATDAELDDIDAELERLSKKAGKKAS